MTSNIDYQSTAVPADKSPTEYSYVERRAELLQLAVEAGHPKALNQSELAERYGVSQQQISKDFTRLSESVATTLGDDQRFVIDTVLQGAMLTLVEQGEPYQAARVARWWADWLAQQGGAEAASETMNPDEMELDERDEEVLEFLTQDAGSPKNTVDSG